MEADILHYLIICPLVFLGGFVDAIAGGGGLISLPAYFLAGFRRIWPWEPTNSQASWERRWRRDASGGRGVLKGSVRFPPSSRR